MQFAKPLLASIGLCLFTGHAFTQQADTPYPAAEIVVNQSGGQTYHHITLEFTNADLALDTELMSRDLAYTLADGGQFEIYVSPEIFPIETPSCGNGVIVRMPWTNPDLPDAENAVAEKAALLDEFNALRAGQAETVLSTVELDPYLALDDAGNPQALIQCNVFFRQASGRYIPHNGPLTAN
ncbi:MAG: hypothetical protein AAF414_06520 [Pseudomonadota bacterium]